MAASTAILNRPSFTPLCVFAKASICNLLSCSRIPTISSICNNLHVPNKFNLSTDNEIKYKRRRTSTYITTYVSRDSRVEEGIEAHEQEAFGAKLAPMEMNRLEAFLNDLVSIFTSSYHIIF